MQVHGKQYTVASRLTPSQTLNGCIQTVLFLYKQFYIKTVCISIAITKYLILFCGLYSRPIPCDTAIKGNIKMSLSENVLNVDGIYKPR